MKYYVLGGCTQCTFEECSKRLYNKGSDIIYPENCKDFKPTVVELDSDTQEEVVNSLFELEKERGSKILFTTREDALKSIGGTE